MKEGDLVIPTDIWRKEFLGTGIVIIAKGDTPHHSDHALVMWPPTSMWPCQEKPVWWPIGGLEIVEESQNADKQK